MSYKLKTLIVFDTNSLRSTEAGEVAYSFFAFGRPFQVIENFIEENKLEEDIHLAIPSWAIEELKVQKIKQYEKDVEDYRKLIDRLMGMPGLGRFNLPPEDFDCMNFIREKANEFLQNKNIKLLEINDENAYTVLRSMMKRVMKDENKKKPFAHSGKYKDAGFKDNIVWESLMHFEGVENYDKIIFLTKDGDYKNCEPEFLAKWQRHITIWKDENNVLADIQKDYDNYIKERVIYDFAQSEYFMGYLISVLDNKALIMIDQIEQPIRDFSVLTPCELVDRIPINDQDVRVLIKSKILIQYKWDDESREQEVEATTILEDDETKEIISTEYDFELL